MSETDQETEKDLKMCTGIIIIALILFPFFEYTTEWWLSYFFQKTVDIPWYASVIACLFWVPNRKYPIFQILATVGSVVTLICSYAMTNNWYVPN